MLKKILESIDSLSEELKKLYVKKDDGKFHLQVEDDDAEPLRRAKEHEVGLRKIAEKERDEAKAALELANTEITTLKASAPKDVQTLRDSLTAEHEAKVKKLKDDHAAEKTGLESTIKKIFVHDVASGIAKDIAIDDGAAELLTDAIARRLTVEMVDGTPHTRVTSADGKASAMTPDELKQEYFTNARYAGIMRATDASGGGASNGKKRSGAPTDLDELGDAERNALQKENPALFNQLVEKKRNASKGR